MIKYHFGTVLKISTESCQLLSKNATFTCEPIIGHTLYVRHCVASNVVSRGLESFLVDPTLINSVSCSIRGAAELQQ